MTSISSLRTGLMLALWALSAPGSLAQQTPAPTPPPVVAPVPAETPKTDFEKPSADASGGVQKELEARPALRVKGTSTWDEGFATLRKTFLQLEQEAKQAGLVKTGQPLAHFIDSDDLGFTFEAYLPLAAATNPDVKLPTGFEGATTPPGKVMMFGHEGAYDDIDSAYEAITAWLDEKGLASTGKFLEEYLTMPEKSDEPGMKLNIYVFLK